VLPPAPAPKKLPRYVLCCALRNGVQRYGVKLKLFGKQFRIGCKYSDPMSASTVASAAKRYIRQDKIKFRLFIEKSPQLEELMCNIFPSRDSENVHEVSVLSVLSDFVQAANKRSAERLNTKMFGARPSVQSWSAAALGGRGGPGPGILSHLNSLRSDATNDSIQSLQQHVRRMVQSQMPSAGPVKKSDPGWVEQGERLRRQWQGLQAAAASTAAAGGPVAKRARIRGPEEEDRFRENGASDNRAVASASDPTQRDTSAAAAAAKSSGPYPMGNAIEGQINEVLVAKLFRLQQAYVRDISLICNQIDKACALMGGVLQSSNGLDSTIKEQGVECFSTLQSLCRALHSWKEGCPNSSLHHL